MMIKFLTTSLLIAGLSCTTQAASFDDAIKNATTSGQFRMAYISVNSDIANSISNYGAAFGGHLKYETAKWNQFQFAIAPYFSTKIDALTGDSLTKESNSDFFTASNKSFVYLGEAYVNYAFAKGTVRLGRQQLDNPFINTDDIRMLKNTFSAAWLKTELTDELTFEVGHVNRWAGIDSGGNQDEFKEAGVDGVSAIGFNYKLSKTLSTQGWYYSFNKRYTLLYADTDYSKDQFSLSAQVASYQEKNTSNIDGNVFGVTASYEIGALTLAAAVNHAENDTNKVVDLGLGGGNFYTSMDEMTINGLSGASAHVVTADYAVSDDFTITLASGHFEDKNKVTTDTNETNLTLAYDINKKLYIEYIYMLVDNKADPTGPDTNFTRNLLRASYTF